MLELHEAASHTFYNDQFEKCGWRRNTPNTMNSQSCAIAGASARVNNNFAQEITDIILGHRTQSTSRRNNNRLGLNSSLDVLLKYTDNERTRQNNRSSSKLAANPLMTEWQKCVGGNAEPILS